MAVMKQIKTLKKSEPAKTRTIADIEAMQEEAGDSANFRLDKDGNVVVDLDPIVEKDSDFSYDEDEHYKNLVDELDTETLDLLGQCVLDNVQADENDRSDWLKTIEFGLDLLGVKVEEKNVPFEGACSAQHPLLMESAVKFQSKASNELFPADGPVKTKVLGETSVEKEKRANRVRNHMNFQITEEMTEYYPDSERMLLYVAIVGSGFKKVYYDAHLERPVSEFIPADQVIVPNSAPDLMRSPRYTHILYPSKDQLNAKYASGFYQEPNENNGLGEPQAPKLTEVTKKASALMGVEIGVSENSQVYTLYEQHLDYCFDDLDQDQDSDYCLAYPYIVTVDANSGKVIGLRRNWKKGDVKRRKKCSFIHYSFVPGFGFYAFGFLHLLGNLQLSLTAAMRSLVDAGQFATLQGGFKLKGVRIIDDGSPIYPGQFKEIEAAVQDINKAIMPLPFKEPSQVLFQMLEFLDQKGQKFADSTEQVIADSTNYGPVGTTMALLDASTKFFSAIHKRLHASLKQELKTIAAINAETLDEDMEYNIENETLKVSRADYDATVDVVPVSDPNISSSSHRMAKAQTILQVAQSSPDLFDMKEVLKHVLVNMDYDNVDRILPDKQKAQPNDPITDIQMAQQGLPIKAFPGQDHKAHIALKQAFMMDPMSGGNAMMQKLSITLQANIQEHMLLQFSEQVQAQAELAAQQQQTQNAQGGSVGPQEQMDPMAQAAQQIAQMNQQKLQKEQEQAKMNPRDQASMLLAQAELMDTETQARKQRFDEVHKTATLELQKEKLDLDRMKEATKMDDAAMGREHDLEKIVTTKGLDAMISSLSTQFDVRRDKIDKAHEKDLKAMDVKKQAAMKKPVDK